MSLQLKKIAVIRFAAEDVAGLGLAALVALFISLAGAVPGCANPAAGTPERQAAPDLDGGTVWFNTARPLHLADLRGKVVLLDFWTFCCINCIHTLPELARLEKKYANQLVVVGVHSAKFDNEKVSENIRKAVLRYEITHPVVNDSQMKIWETYGSR